MARDSFLLVCLVLLPGLLAQSVSSSAEDDSQEDIVGLHKRMLDPIGGSLLKKRMLDPIGSSLLRKRMLDPIGGSLLKKRMLDPIGSSLLRKRMLDPIGGSLLRKRMLDPIGSSLLRKRAYDRYIGLQDPIASEYAEEKRMLDPIGGNLLRKRMLDPIGSSLLRKRGSSRGVDLKNMASGYAYDGNDYGYQNSISADELADEQRFRALAAKLLQADKGQEVRQLDEIAEGLVGRGLNERGAGLREKE